MNELDGENLEVVNELQEVDQTMSGERRAWENIGRLHDKAVKTGTPTRLTLEHQDVGKYIVLAGRFERNTDQPSFLVDMVDVDDDTTITEIVPNRFNNKTELDDDLYTLMGDIDETILAVDGPVTHVVRRGRLFSPLEFDDSRKADFWDFYSERNICVNGISDSVSDDIPVLGVPLEVAKGRMLEMYADIMGGNLKKQSSCIPFTEEDEYFEDFDCEDEFGPVNKSANNF